MDNDITSVEDEAFDNLTNIKEINLAGKRSMNQVPAREMKRSRYLLKFLDPQFVCLSVTLFEKCLIPDCIESLRMLQHMLLQFPPEFYGTVGLVSVSLSTGWAED